MPFEDSQWDASSVESSLSAGEYCSVSLVDNNPSGAEKTKAQCHFPAKKRPGAPYNVGALRAIVGGRGAQANFPGAEAARERARRLLAEYQRTQASADDPIEFDDPVVPLTFRVNPEKRTISGLLVPWNKVAKSGYAKWRFGRGSLRWVDESRVKLNLGHDRKQAIGVAVRLQDTAAGLDGTFKIARGEEGDRALSLAEDKVLDGFSIEVDFEEGDGYEADSNDESINAVSLAKLVGVGLTGFPAFDDARVARVAAARRNGGGMEPEETQQLEQEQPGAAFDQAMAGLADRITESHTKLTEELAQSVGESISAGVKVALEGISVPQDGPQPVRAARYAVTREAPIYSFDGRGPSMVRDAWYASREHDDEAKDRLRKFSQQSNEVQKIVADRLSFIAGERLGFTTQTTTTGASIIPPGYRPDLFVPQLEQGRPLINALSRGTIANATPFVVPIFGSETGLTGTHTEGSAPPEGSITFTTATVTPGAVSGKLPLTREIVDSSNPAIDQIALAAMREDYARQTEAKAYTEINGANGVGGTITAGVVPSGAQAITSTGGSAAAGTFGGLELLRAVRRSMAIYPFRRFGAPDRIVLSQEGTSAFATAEDSQNHPLLPSLGPTNVLGQGSTQAGWSVDGLSAYPAWSMTGNAAGDADVIGIKASDVWAWESGILSFRFEEKSGPQIIELALFGYFAVRVLRPSGLFAVRHTVGA